MTPPQPTPKMYRRRLHKVTAQLTEAGNMDALMQAVEALEAIARWFPPKAEGR